MVKTYLYKTTILFTLLCLSMGQSINGALGPHTLISTTHGEQKIESLTREDTVLGFNQNTSDLLTTKIENISCEKVNTVIEIAIDTEIITASVDQLFYDENLKKFISAKDLTLQSILLDKNGSIHRCKTININNNPTIVYELNLEKPHLFFCGKTEILSHNIAWAATPWMVTTLEAIAGFCVTTACLYVSKPTGKIDNLNPIASQTRQVQSKVINPRYFDPQKKNAPHPETISRKASWMPSPPKIHGIRPNPKIYHDILTHPYKYGPYQAIATMTSEGRVACMLFALKFHSRTPLPSGNGDHLGFGWQVIGTEVFKRNDPFVRSFVQAEDRKQIKVLKNFYERVKFPIRSKIQQSKCDIGITENYLNQAHGNLDKTIYGWTFGVFSVYNMGQKAIAPSAVIEALYCGVTLRDDHPERVTCNHKKGNLSVLVHRASKKIMNVERYSDYEKKKEEKEKESENEEEEESEEKKKAREESQEEDEGKEKDEREKVIEEIIGEAEPSKEKKKKRRGKNRRVDTNQHEKPEAKSGESSKDLKRINPDNVRTDGEKTIGDLPGKITIISRPESKEGRETLEIQYKEKGKVSKIRYGPPTEKK